MGRNRISFGRKGDERACDACGMTYVLDHSRQQYCTLECQLEAVATANGEMHRKSGPAYDKWCSAMARWANAQLDLTAAAAADREAARGT